MRTIGGLLWDRERERERSHTIKVLALSEVEVVSITKNGSTVATN